jgi:NADH-dependent peroxiredoxin subunit C
MNDTTHMENEISFPLILEDIVPDINFDLYDPKEDAIVQHKMSDYRGKWLVLFFYPADFTFVCPTELKDLHQSYAALQEAGAEVLVASVDTAFSHKRWVETEGLLKDFGIKMISDRTTELSMIFGVLNTETGNSERGTFIISPEGVIKSIEVVTEPIGRSSIELIRKVNALNYVAHNPGHACPASWNIGNKTLQPGVKIAGNVGKALEE